MIEEACEAIEVVREHDRLQAESKYWRRNTMRYIDKLLNELEMLNLRGHSQTPAEVDSAVAELIAEAEMVALVGRPRVSIIETMDVLFEIQDSLMFNQIEES
ncbi:MAG: hypothetical protein ACREN8_12825 [Candidatus Dormibacteraceae bacterium]